MNCASPSRITVSPPNEWEGTYSIRVPCNKCGNCQAARRAAWSFRLKWEEKDSIYANFLTLTYSDENLVYGSCTRPTLVKRDLQLFLKRLRKENTKHLNGVPIRYYAVGEYGSNTYRPHYHLIAFNVHPETVKRLPQVWGLGHTNAQPVNDARIHYVSKFHLNYREKSDETVLPEFAVMSTRPGIGFSFIEKNPDWNINNEALYVINNGFKQAMPRYFKKKLFPEGTPQAIEYKRIAAKAKAEGLENELNEIKRLEALGHENGFEQMMYAFYIESLQIQHKNRNTDTLF